MLSVQPKGKQKGCAGCNRKIKDRYLLKALDQYWHEDCLKCACCDCRLGEVGSTLYTKANLILCRRDYLRWAASPTPHAPRPCRPESPLLHTGPALPCFSPHTQSTHILPPAPAPGTQCPALVQGGHVSNHRASKRSLPRAPIWFCLCFCQALLTHPVPGIEEGMR